MIIKLDLYAGAWASEFEKPFFNDDQDEPSLPNPRKVTMESDQTNAETCSTPG